MVAQSTAVQEWKDERYIYFECTKEQEHDSGVQPASKTKTIALNLDSAQIAC